MNSILRFKLMGISILFLMLIACGEGTGTSQPDATNATNATNDTPVALDQSLKTNNNISIDIVLSGTDEEGDSLTYTITADPQSGTLSGTAPNLTYTPNMNFAGDDRFSFTVNDGTLTSAAATVTIKVEFIADSAPDAFAFINRPEVPPGDVVISNAIFISGINTPTKVVITNGEYSINGAAYTAEEGLINHRQNIRVRLTASSVAAETVETQLTIGGVTGVFQLTTSSDITQPTAQIIFPALSAATTAESIRVRGSAADDGTIVSVTVNGIAASSNDKFLNWTASVPLKPGMNNISVLVTDRGGNSNDSASINVDSRPSFFLNKRQIAYHNASAKLMFYDDTDNRKGLYAFDRSSQDYQIISDDSKPVEGLNRFNSLRDFAIDETSGLAYTIDGGNSFDRVMQVDLNTGLRTVLTEDTQAYAAHTLITPRLIEIDSAAKIAYVFDGDNSGLGGRKAIIAFDLSTGAASLLSDNSFAGPRYTWPSNIALDKNNDRLLLTDTFYRRVLAIDLKTGNRDVLLIDQSSPIKLNQPKGIAVDSQKNRALVYDSNARGIFAINFETGALSSVVEDLSLNVNVFSSIDMVYDGGDGTVDQDRVFIVAEDVVYQIDLKTGEESIFSSNTIPNESNPLNKATGLTIDPAKNRLLVTTRDTSQIIAINLENGERSIVSNNLTIPDDLNPLDTPMDIAISGDQAYVVDAGNLSIITVDLMEAANGARSILSSSLKGDENNTFHQLTAVAVDAANAHTLVLDSGRRALFSVDNASGERAVISDNFTPDSANSIIKAAGLIIHGGRGFIADAQKHSILSVDLQSGVRTVFSGPEHPAPGNYQMRSPTKMVLDAANNRLLVVANNAIIAVSLADGSRSLLASQYFPTNGPRYKNISDITLDIENKQVLMLDSGLQRIFAIDLASGERAYYAGGVPNASGLSIEPTHIALDSESNKALIITNKSGSRGLIKMDMATGVRAQISTTAGSDLAFGVNNKLYWLWGNRLLQINAMTADVEKIISSPEIPPDGDNVFSSARALALDTESQRAYVYDSTLETLLSIDIETGARKILSSNSVPNESTLMFSRYIFSLVFDAANERLFALDRTQGVIAIDLREASLGIRSAFSTNDIPNSQNRWTVPTAMILDKANKRLLVTATGYIDGEFREGLYAVDLATGARTRLFTNSEYPSFLSRDKQSNRARGISLISPELALITDIENGVVLMDLSTGEQVIVAQ